MHVRVLIVDDERLARQRVRRLVQSEADVEVVGEAASGHEAVALIRELRPDLVCLDVQMPGLDGLETTRILRARGVTSPVVALTANALAGDREMCLAAGMTDYLPKPLDLAELRAVVQRISAA